MKKRVLNRALAVALSLAVASSTLVSFAVVASAEETVLPDPVKVVDFSYNFEELAAKDEAFEVVENAAKPSLVEDDEMGQVLQLGKAVVKGQEFGTGGNLIADESEYSTIKLSNPYVGRDYLKEYEPYEDVEITVNRNCEQPDWQEGITISYWIKSPNGVNSNVVGFTSERYQMQADDYAKYLCTVRFNVEYSQYTDEEKVALGLNESGVTPNSDFYFEYAPEREYAGLPCYVDEKYMGRTYWFNKNYLKGYVKTDGGAYNNSRGDGGSNDVDGGYARWSVAPTLTSEGPDLDPKSPNYTKGGHEPGTSNIRYAWTYSEMWLDASSSFYFEDDNKTDIQLNPNQSQNYKTVVGMMNNDCFSINSWKLNPTIEEAIANGDQGPSPVSEPDEWHHVAAVIQNDWVMYYLDGEEIDIEEYYSSYGGTGLAEARGGEKPWKRFNKGAGSRYGYGNDKTQTYYYYYGNFVAPTMMEWIILDCVDLTIGGGNKNGDGYNMFANTDEVLIKNVVFYDKVLDGDQVELLAADPFMHDKKNEQKPPVTTGTVGDVNLDGNINAQDALLVLQHAAKITTLEGEAASNADVTDDASINASDALDILRYAARIITEFTKK